MCMYTLPSSVHFRLQLSLSLSTKNTNMQAANLQEKMNTDFGFGSEKEGGGDFYERMKIMEISRRDLALKMEECKIAEISDEEEEEESEEEEEEEEEEEFSFSFSGGDAAAIAAEEAFSNGQIKAVFPLFDQSLLLSGDGDEDYLHQNLPMRPPVKKVFVETKEERGGAAAESSEVVGPYCEWSSRKAVEASPEACKKSNSTGFSKIWRLKEITCRSNSDGRDAFVFLNGSHAPPLPQVAAPAAEKKEVAAKKVKKGKKAASPHEVYLRSKAKEEERRRSYLPYRPELMGFFTNINGGLSRNVHPY